MKKYLFSLLTLFVSATLCLSLVSCGDDDNDGGRAMSSPLTGSWIPAYAIDNTGNKTEYNFPNVTETFYENGQWHTTTYSYLDKDNKGGSFPKFYIKGDGTGYGRTFSYYYGKYEEQDATPIVYTENGNEVTIRVSSEFIDFVKKNSTDMTDSDFEKMENFVLVLTYDSEKETLTWPMDGGIFYFKKQ